MKSFSIRANVHVDAQVKDRDLWAVNLVEDGKLSDQLMAGWFWATWPDRVELVFSVRADDVSIRGFTKEIELLLKNAPHVTGQAQLVVEEQRANEA